jgi:hypothetical protein
MGIGRRGIMAKKAVKRSAKRSAKLTPDEVHLLKLIEVSEKVAKEQNGAMDDLFGHQVTKLKKELASLRNK